MRSFYGKEEQPNMATMDAEKELKAQEIIGGKEIKEAAQILTKYKQGKANLEKRVVDDELWWELRHWETIRKQKAKEDVTPEPTSAWLFNSILNKHSDAMDNYPEPVVLPRERSDEESAKRLSDILPVVMEQTDFQSTYSNQWWEKLKHGTAVYGIFWNPQLENSLGDIDIKGIDMLNIFWEPGIQDIQKSANLFIVDMVDRKIMEEQYPKHKGKFTGDVINIQEYCHDESIDTSDKVVVVDWYYKVHTTDGRSLLHYVKFCSNVVLYASENDEDYRDRGWYDHGLYPVVFDTMFPEKGTPAGFGYVTICKDPQMYIDKLQGNILQSSMMGTKKRFFVSNSTNIKEDEFLDWTKQLVHVEGELNDTRIKEIDVQPIAPVYQSVLQMKIEEMKETSANRDISNGGSTGVSAAAAIAALQEAGNKVSRNLISASYKAFRKVVQFVIELMRQFYDERRSYRITGKMPGEYEYVEISNLELSAQKTGTNAEGEILYRVPIFDLKIKAQKTNPFSRMEENERAKELYQLGFFNPENAQQALNALEMMNFEGIEKVREKISEGHTLLNLVQQQGQAIAQLQAMMGIAPQISEESGGRQMPSGSAAANAESGKDESIDGKVLEAQTPMTSYGERLAKRSAPNMDITSAAATPGKKL